MIEKAKNEWRPCTKVPWLGQQAKQRLLKRGWKVNEEGGGTRAKHAYHS